MELVQQTVDLEQQSMEIAQQTTDLAQQSTFSLDPYSKKLKLKK
ncbi:hypothetical protein ABE042_10245 [Viridibacillus arvi]